MNKITSFLFDEIPAAGPAGGSGDGGGLSNTGGTGESLSNPSVVKDVWGNREAPTWVKETGLAKKHEEVNQKVGTPTNPSADQLPTPDSQGQQVTQTQPDPTKANVQPDPDAAQVQTDPNKINAQPPLPAGFDYEKFASTMAAAMKPAAPGQPGPTPEQIRQQLAIFEANAQDYEDILGIKPDSPARLVAFNRVLQAIAKQAATVSNVLAQNSINEIQGRMGPVVAAVQAQKAEEQKTLFFKEHADLTGYDALIEKEFTALIASGYKVSNLDAARKVVADRTRETLKALGITPVAGAARPQGQNTLPTGGQAPRQSRQMAPTSGGGRGAGSAQALAKSTNTVEAVWGKRQ